MSRTLAAILLVFAAVATAEAQQAPAKPTVRFEGEGSVSAVPDQVQISCSIWGRDENSKLAREQQATRSKKALEALKKAGVEEKQIKTTSYSFWTVSEYDQVKQKNVMVGYQAEQGLHICAPINLAPDLTDALTEWGLIRSVAFTVSNSDGLKEKAVKAAIEDAKAKAKMRAKDVGFKLGRIVGYEESARGSEPVYAGLRAARGDIAPGSAPSLPSGQNEIRVTVQLVYEID